MCMVFSFGKEATAAASCFAIVVVGEAIAGKSADRVSCTMIWHICQLATI